MCIRDRVLDCGKTKFLGELAELQEQFAGDQTRDNQSLEQAFFSALGDAQGVVDAELGLSATNAE